MSAEDRGVMVLLVALAEVMMRSLQWNGCLMVDGGPTCDCRQTGKQRCELVFVVRPGTPEVAWDNCPN